MIYAARIEDLFPDWPEPRKIKEEDFYTPNNEQISKIARSIYEGQTKKNIFTDSVNQVFGIETEKRFYEFEEIYTEISKQVKQDALNWENKKEARELIKPLRVKVREVHGEGKKLEFILEDNPIGKKVILKKKWLPQIPLPNQEMIMHLYKGEEAEISRYSIKSFGDNGEWIPPVVEKDLFGLEPVLVESNKWSNYLDKIEIINEEGLNSVYKV
jgi:hypothetical protein